MPNNLAFMSHSHVFCHSSLEIRNFDLVVSGCPLSLTQIVRKTTWRSLWWWFSSSTYEISHARNLSEKLFLEHKLSIVQKWRALIKFPLARMPVPLRRYPTSRIATTLWQTQDLSLVFVFQQTDLCVNSSRHAIRHYQPQDFRCIASR